MLAETGQGLEIVPEVRGEQHYGTSLLASATQMTPPPPSLASQWRAWQQMWQTFLASLERAVRSAGRCPHPVLMSARGEFAAGGEAPLWLSEWRGL